MVLPAAWAGGQLSTRRTVCTARQPSPRPTSSFFCWSDFSSKYCAEDGALLAGASRGAWLTGEQGQASKKALFRINPQGTLAQIKEVVLTSY